MAVVVWRGGRGSVVFRSISRIGLRWQQELDAKITEEISLVAAPGFEAAFGHEEEDDRTMEFVAATNVNIEQKRKPEESTSLMRELH